MKPKEKQAFQILALTLWSFAFVVPVLLHTGPNIVIWTYLDGVRAFFSGGNPYLPPGPGHDMFHYPPVFAMLYGLFALLPDKPQVLAWAFFNSFLFWAGVSSWFRVERKQSIWSWILLAACAMELDISLRYQQSNAMLAGLVLLGLASFRDKRFGRAGFFLAAATSVKVFPFAIGLALLFPWNKRFAFSFFGSGLALILVPSFVVGISHDLWLHYQQVLAVTQDLSHRQLLDIKSCFIRLGLPEVGSFLQWTTVLVTAALVILTRVYSSSEMRWGYWYTVIMASVLIATPRAESPTFVWIAPAYLFFANEKTKLGKALVFLIAFSITIVYTSAVSAKTFHFMRFEWTSKTLGTYALWILAGIKMLPPLSSFFRPIRLGAENPA